MSEHESFDRLGLSAAIAAALRTGLLMELTKGRATAAELASRLGLDVRGTSLVLELLACEKLACHDGDGFSAGAALHRMGEGPGGHSLALGMWAHVETFLRTGEPFVRLDQPQDREAAYRRGVSWLGRVSAAAAEKLAAQLPLAPTRILDVGCGSGVWSLAIAARYPGSHATGLDFPAVLEAFTARAAELAMAERVSTIAGNMHTVSIPAGAFDLVVIANVLRLEPPDRAAALLLRVASALDPGGSLLLIDALAHGTPARERARSVYALHLGLRTKEGEVHRPETITTWLAAAGLTRVQPIDVEAVESGVGGLLASRE